MGPCRATFGTMKGYILSGGGARGAYEAGVLRFVLQDFPRRTGVDPTPDVITGTSIGALTGAWVGALGAAGSQSLTELWQNLTVDRVYRLSARDLARLPEKLLGRAGQTGIFDPGPLGDLIRQELPWPLLHGRIDRGELRAFACAATDVASGFCTVFVDGVPMHGHDHPTTRILPVRVQAEHCLASAAIPLIFPPVQVEGRWYVDGALRQNTPLSPALSLGVDRALVIGVKRTRSLDEISPDIPVPTPAFLAGKALNALMLDPVEEDLRRLQSLNRLVGWGATAYPDFVDRLTREHRPYREVRTVYLRPSEDLGRMAGAVYASHAPRLPWATRMLLRSLAGEGPGEADLLSYLLFDRAYTGELEALGWSDAAAQEDELVALFSEETRPPPFHGDRAPLPEPLS